MRDNPTSPSRSVAITLKMLSFDHKVIELSYAPNKFVATISEEIDDGTRGLYSKKIAATFYEQEVKQEDDDRLCRDEAKYFWVKAGL